jgi:hypothetical protein
MPADGLTQPLSAATRGFHSPIGYGSIWQTLKAMDWLLTKLEAEKDQTVKHPTDYPEYYKACVQTAWAKLNDYYIKQRVEGDDVEQSDREPATILIASSACD